MSFRYLDYSVARIAVAAGYAVPTRGSVADQNSLSWQSGGCEQCIPPESERPLVAEAKAEPPVSIVKCIHCVEAAALLAGEVQA